MNRQELIEIIDFAIKGEEEAHQFYLDAKEKVTEDTLKDLFQDLADEELEHKEFLSEFKESDAQTIRIKPAADYKIAESSEAPEFTTDVSLPEAIMIAIKNEESSMNMYQGLAQAAEDVEIRDVFTGLANMELLHKSRLEEVYTNVAYREVW